MLRRTRLVTISWIALALILLNVLVPVLAQSLQTASTQADHLMMAELCSASGMSAADHAAADPADGSDPQRPADRLMPQHCACCSHAPLALVLPGVAAPVLILPAAAEPPVPTEPPRSPLHHARAPLPARAPPAAPLG